MRSPLLSAPSLPGRWPRAAARTRTRDRRQLPAGPAVSTIDRKLSWIRGSSANSGWKAVTTTGPWRQHTGCPSTVARTSTPVPTRSTNGARMNTACTGSGRRRRRRPGRPRTSRPGGRTRCGARRCRWRRSCAGRAARRARPRPAGSSRRRSPAPAGPRRAARPAGRRAAGSPAAATSWSTRRRAGPARRPARARRACAPRACGRRGELRMSTCRPTAPWSARTPMVRSVTSRGRRRSTSSDSISSPRMAAPRPRLTLASTSGLV